MKAIKTGFTLAVILIGTATILMACAYVAAVGMGY